MARARARRRRSPARSDDPVVARVNGADIRQSDLAIAEEDLGSNVPQMTPEAKRDYLITFVADMMLVAKAAEAKKMGDGDDFKRKLAYARTKLLMEQLLQTEAKAAVTEAAMRKVYDEAIGQMKKEPEVRARHILVETEDEAKAVRRRAEEGRGFRRARQDQVEGPGLGRTAATSATSPRTRWCRNSPKSRSSSTRARCPIR